MCFVQRSLVQALWLSSLYISSVVSVYAQVSVQPTVPSLVPVEVVGQHDMFDVRSPIVSTATKTALDTKDIPQTVDTVHLERHKDYGITRLSTILDGVPNITTSPDMRSDSIQIRGFAAQSGDIYLDGIRASGQVRHSTANIERIEILKGPASVLYGRGSGGGIVNQISKHARFGQVSNLAIRGGSWQRWGGMLDLNRELSANIALRLTTDVEHGQSFRWGIKHRNRMVSPSILYDNHQNFSWLVQYTYDKAWRVPDRGPAWTSLPSDMTMRRTYAHPDDYVEDVLRYARSEVRYRFTDQWAVRWTLADRRQAQNFDHMYGGSVCNAEGKNTSTGRICQPKNTLQGRARAWQYTDNHNLTTSVELSGRFTVLDSYHDLLVGTELSKEKRLPELAVQRGTEAPLDIYQPHYGIKPPQGQATMHNAHTVKAKALYVQDLISFGSAWKALLGIRAERYEFKSTKHIEPKRQRSYSGTTVSPRIGVIWQPWIRHSFYAQYSKNFSPYGGMGLISISVDEKAIYNESPEYSRQYEVGMKSDWLDNNLSSHIALFRLERYNIRYRPDPIHEPDRWDVAGKERTQGIELTIAGSLTKNWYLRSGYGWQSAKVIQAVNQPQREGQYKRNVARHNGHLFLTYAREQGLIAETGLTYVGSQWADIPNTRKQAGFLRWDAMLGWRTASWHAHIAVVNLANKKYWRTNTLPGQPRSVLVTANYRF